MSGESNNDVFIAEFSLIVLADQPHFHEGLVVHGLTVEHDIVVLMIFHILFSVFCCLVQLLQVFFILVLTGSWFSRLLSWGDDTVI